MALFHFSFQLNNECFGTILARLVVACYKVFIIFQLLTSRLIIRCRKQISLIPPQIQRERFVHPFRYKQFFVKRHFYVPGVNKIPVYRFKFVGPFMFVREVFFTPLFTVRSPYL